MQKLALASIVLSMSLVGACGGRVDDIDDASPAIDAATLPDTGPSPDAGRDGGTIALDGGHDAGRDAGSDGGMDGGHDGGSDGGHDGGSDGGHDVGPPDGGHDSAIDAYAAYTFDSPLQIDMSGVLTNETVASTTVTEFPPLSAIDGSGYVYVTASYASASFDDGAGLPDDGAYDANADHPPIQLAFRDATTQLDSIVLNDPAMGRTRVDVPVTPTGAFRQLFVYLTSTEGSSTPTITLHYSDGTSSSVTPTVPDWFQPFDAAGAVFVVQSGLSRYSASGYDAADTPALFGVAITADAAKVLTGFSVDDAVGTARLTVYGANAY